MNRQSGRLEVGCVNERFKRLAAASDMDWAIDNGVLPVSLSWCRICTEHRRGDPLDVDAEHEALLDEVERERWGDAD